MINDITSSNDTLRSKAVETRDNITDMAHIAKDAVKDKYNDLKEKASQKYDEGKMKLGEFEESMACRVREAPMKSVLIAAGVGLAVGFLWRRG
jgi:ElaB/YqjD/DUF883 family membrane-anchored ribosome-binding protein